MPNTRIYPQLTTDQLNAAIDQAFAAVDPVGLQQELEYFQWKLASVFKIPRRFLGLTDEELATNSEYQRAERRRAERTDERQNSADRYQRQIDILQSVQAMQNIPHPDGRIYYMDFIYGAEKEKPLSGGFVFKLKRLNFGLTDVFL